MAAHIRDYQGGRVAFVGIGGCSMSGLAGLMKELGYQVTGSDRTASHKTEHLEAQGIPVSIGHRPENVRGADLVVYTAAIPSDNPERAEARRLGIPRIMALGTGTQLDPTQLRLADLSETYGCPLARVMRKELRSRGILHQKVVFSPEEPAPTQQLEAPPPGRRSVPASNPWVPAAAGLLLGSAVVRDILNFTTAR